MAPIKSTDVPAPAAPLAVIGVLAPRGRVVTKANEVSVRRLRHPALEELGWHYQGSPLFAFLAFAFDLAFVLLAFVLLAFAFAFVLIGLVAFTAAAA